VQGTTTDMNPELKPTSKIELDKQPSTTDVARIVNNDPEIKQRREGFTKREKVFATIGALSLLGGGAAAANYFSSNAEHNTDRDSSTAGPAKPGAIETTAPSASAEPSPYASPANTTALETAKPVETESTKDTLIKSLEIPAGLNDVEFSQKVTDVLSKWDSAGFEDASAEDMIINKKYGANDIVRYVTEKVDTDNGIYAEALFGAEWEKNPKAVSFTKGTADFRKYVMELRVRSSTEAVPFEVETNYESLVQTFAAPEGTRIVKISTISESNETESNAEDIIATKGGKSLNGQKVFYTVTSKSNGSTEVITDIEASSK
jgi:hypothetical protein